MIKELGVHTIDPISEQIAKVGVRVHEGTVRIGDVFKSLWTSKRTPPDETSKRAWLGGVELEITAIESYGQTLESLDCGLTGYVTLRGHGIELLFDRSILQTESLTSPPLSP
jgi:hypothetical protein